MSIKSQQQNMKTIYSLVSQDLGYIYGERESSPNGAKKQFHTKSAAFLRVLGKDLGFEDFKVTNNHGGIAVSGEITLMGMWGEGEGLSFQISQTFIQPPAFLYRSISHIKDYGDGKNQWLSCDLFSIGDYVKLVEMLMALRTPVLQDTTLRGASADTPQALQDTSKEAVRHVA